MFEKIGRIKDVSEEIQKIIDANAEKYFMIVDICENGKVSIFIGDVKKKKCGEVKGETEADS